MNADPQLIERLQFDTQRLVTEHPPVWRDRNKQIVYEITCPPGSAHCGRLNYSRWTAKAVCLDADPEAAVRRVVARAGCYDHVPARDVPGAME